MKYLVVLLITILAAGCDKPLVVLETTTEEEIILAPETPKIGPEGSPSSYDFVCANDTDLDIYRLNEHYFKTSDPLIFKVHVIHYTNGGPSLFSSFFEKRLDIVNEFYSETGSNLSFKLVKYTEFTNKPEESSKALSFIENLEMLAGHKRNDIRNYYYISHMDFWQNVYGEDKCLNIHVFNDSITSIAGFAGGIGSPYMSVELFYNDPYYNTWEHELGHVLGLYHTHKFDASDDIFSVTEGDKVCDTPKSPPLTGAVDDGCELAENWKTAISKNVRNLSYKTNSVDVIDRLNDENIEVLITNVMSYTKHPCRSSFTEGQVHRMKKIIETNADLRQCIIGLDNPYKQQLWQNLRQY